MAQLAPRAINTKFLHKIHSRTNGKSVKTLTPIERQQITLFTILFHDMTCNLLDRMTFPCTNVGGNLGLNKFANSLSLKTWHAPDTPPNRKNVMGRVWALGKIPSTALPCLGKETIRAWVICFGTIPAFNHLWVMAWKACATPRGRCLSSLPFQPSQPWLPRDWVILYQISTSLGACCWTWGPGGKPWQIKLEIWSSGDQSVFGESKTGSKIHKPFEPQKPKFQKCPHCHSWYDKWRD